MKIVLNYNNIVKLYTEELAVSRLLDFIEEQIGLRKDSIALSYNDSDGDQIGIGSDQDLLIMTSLHEGKEYLKMQVAGEKKTTSETVFDQTRVRIDQVQVELKEEKSAVHEQQSKDALADPKIEENIYNVEDKSPGLEQQKNQVQKRKEMRMLKRQQKTKKLPLKGKAAKTNGNFDTFNTLMTQSIATLVDQRVRALIPCIRAQALSKDFKKEDSEHQIVHQNHTCFLCEAHPILGVRYECPKCENFSLCSNCESTYNHDHNLIKIKKLPEISNEKMDNTIRQLYDQFFKGKQEKKVLNKILDKEVIISNEKHKHFCKDLKLIFGGKIADYKKLVEGNGEATFTQVIGKYCEQHQITQEEGHRKYIENLTTRMSKKFKKEDPLTLTTFIEQHADLNYEELQKMYTEKLKEKKEAEKKAVKAQRQIEKEQRTKYEEMRKKEADRRGKEMLKEKKNPGNQLQGRKRDIYNIMVELCGEERAAEYPSFIESNSTMGNDDIIQAWWDQRSYIERRS